MMGMMIVAWVTGSVLTSKTNFMTLERKIYSPKRNGAGVRARWRDAAGDGVGGGLVAGGRECRNNRLLGPIFRTC